MWLMICIPDGNGAALKMLQVKNRQQLIEEYTVFDFIASEHRSEFRKVSKYTQDVVFLSYISGLLALSSMILSYTSFF